MSAEVFQSLPLPIVDLMAVVLGLNVGSFLNVLALRSLANESAIWPGSHCSKCKHSLSFIDTVPVLSYFMLGRRCRHCGEKIHWQYPVVEVFTALVFLAIERTFLTGNILYDPTVSGGLWAQITTASQLHTPQSISLPVDTRIGLTVGLVLFACTLIAVTITDFREKLIPHEITYPSMIFGLIFSAWRGDLLGAMVGIGASYMLFDYLAFYGLKLYNRWHGDENAEKDLQGDAEDALDESRIAQSNKDEEPMEVMGGGDAVLSAVMSAYLGWQLLLVALMCGFLAGTGMGLLLLFSEMKKAGLLNQCARRAGLFALCGGALAGILALGLVYLFGTDQRQVSVLSALPLATVGAITGAMIGIVTVGTRVSKPFPFGPALALGGMIALFLIPHWIPLEIH